MKVVILAGGLGTRLSEETDVKPKPMVEIGGRPILWHIMKIYSAHGINDVIVCCGYRGYVIKEYFANYFLHMSDVTFDVANNRMEVHNKRAEPWRITLVDTGDETMTGGRLRRVREYLDGGTFCFTYGDDVPQSERLIESSARGGMNTPRRVEVGRLGAAHGVRGWLRVQSYTDPPQRLFEWKLWQLQSLTGAEREVKLLEARPQGNGWIARLEGIEERDAASRLSGYLVLVDRDELPVTTGREHYRADLVGFEAKNVEGVLLGMVDHFVDTPGNAVMVIKGEREHWVPVSAQHLRSVDTDTRRVIVDWPADF